MGKTTTAINLSAYLASAGSRVLIIDIDPQANATSGIGIDKASIKQSIYNVLVGDTDLKDIVLPTSVDNMFLAPADVHLTGAQIELVSAFNREQQLKNRIEPIKQDYNVIIIDCPPSLGLLTINALTASQTTLIPLQCEYYAIEGLNQLLHTIKLVQDNLNAALAIEGVVLTMADFRTNLTDDVIDEAKRFFKDKVYAAIIPRSIRLSEAPGHSKPVMLYDKKSHGAKAYQSLAEEVIKHNTLSSITLQQKNEQDIPKAGGGSTHNEDVPVNILEKTGGDNGEA